MHRPTRARVSHCWSHPRTRLIALLALVLAGLAAASHPAGAATVAHAAADTTEDLLT